MADVLARVRAIAEAGLESEFSDRQYALEAILRVLDGDREQMAAETREALDVALAASAAGLTVDLGDFAQYVDEAPVHPFAAARARIEAGLAAVVGESSGESWDRGFTAGVRMAIAALDEEAKDRG